MVMISAAISSVIRSTGLLPLVHNRDKHYTCFPLYASTCPVLVQRWLTSPKRCPGVRMHLSVLPCVVIQYCHPGPILSTNASFMQRGCLLMQSRLESVQRFRSRWQIQEDRGGVVEAGVLVGCGRRRVQCLRCGTIYGDQTGWFCLGQS